MSVAVTVTPGSTALDSSVMVPVMVACCANAEVAIVTRRTSRNAERSRIERMLMFSNLHSSEGSVRTRVERDADEWKQGEQERDRTAHERRTSRRKMRIVGGDNGSRDDAASGPRKGNEQHRRSSVRSAQRKCQPCVNRDRDKRRRRNGRLETDDVLLQPTVLTTSGIRQSSASGCAHTHQPR
jgi:hypothetical protein